MDYFRLLPFGGRAYSEKSFPLSPSNRLTMVSSPLAEQNMKFATN